MCSLLQETLSVWSTLSAYVNIRVNTLLRETEEEGGGGMCSSESVALYLFSKENITEEFNVSIWLQNLHSKSKAKNGKLSHKQQENYLFFLLNDFDLNTE